MTISFKHVLAALDRNGNGVIDRQITYERYQTQDGVIDVPLNAHPRNATFFRLRYQR